MKPLRLQITGLLPVFILSHFIHHLLTSAPTPILPFIRNEFGLDYTRSGLVITAFSLSYGIGQLPAGWLADRIGPVLLITLGFYGVAVAGVLVGLSDAYILLLAGLAFLGLMGGGYHPAAPPIISSVVEKHRRSQALGFHMIGGGIAYFLAPIVAVSIASAWGWRWVFIGLAVPTMLFGVFIYRILGRWKGGIKGRSVGPGAVEDDPPPTSSARALFFLILLSTTTAAVIFSVISMIPLYMVDHFKADPAVAGISQSVIYSAGLWVSPIAGYLADRLGRIRVLIAACTVGCFLIYLVKIVPYGIGFFALLLSLGIVTYVRMPVSESFIIEYTSPKNRSTVLGFYYFGAMEGCGLMTGGLGYLIDRVGFSTGLTVVSIFLLLITGICSLGLPTKKV